MNKMMDIGDFMDTSVAIGTIGNDVSTVEVDKYTANKMAEASRAMFQLTHEMEDKVKESLKMVVEGIVDLKNNKPALDKEWNIIETKINELRGMKGKDPNELKEEAKNVENLMIDYSAKLTMYSGVIQNAAKQGFEIEKGNPMLMMMKPSFSNHNEMLEDMKAIRIAMKGIVKEQVEKRKELVTNIAKMVTLKPDKYQAEAFGELLKDGIDKYPQSMQQEFKEYNLNENAPVMIALKYMTEVFDYKKESITPEFLDKEEAKISKNLKELMEQCKAVDKKIEGYAKELGKMAISDDGKMPVDSAGKEVSKEKLMEMREVAEESGNAFAKLGNEKEKLSVVKSLNNERKREQNFHKNVKPTLYS